MPDYQLSKIYKLVSNKTEDIYIGSCLMRLSTRLSQHKNKSNQAVSKKLFTDDAIITIVLVESFPCNTKNELKARELHHITTNNCINANKPFVCEIPYADTKAYTKAYNIANKENHKEYYAINAEHIKSKAKEYYAINAEQIKSKAKEYYTINAEQIKSKSKEYNSINAEHIKEYAAAHREQRNATERARCAKKKLLQNVEHNLNNNSIIV